MNEIFVSLINKELKETESYMRQIKNTDADNWNAIELQLKRMLQYVETIKSNNHENR